MTTSTSPAPAAPTGIVADALPVAAAIGIFGVVYGAAARTIIGPGPAVLSSLLTFSGAAQFTAIALVAAGAGAVGVLGGITALAVRHLPLGAVLRPRLTADRRRRALLACFLTDETTGLVLARGAAAERTLATSGALAYGAWVLGTIGGVAGASAASVEPLAQALFPVLFVGLTALTARSRSDAGRAVLSGGAALVLLVAWPAAGALGAIAVAVVVATVVPRP